MSHLKPLKIGTKTFPINLIQAPLAGISCAPFRQLVWDFGSVAYCCTEMLSAHHLDSGVDRSPRYNTKYPSEGPLCFQLSGNQPDVLARASARAIALGADLLDLNCGCPQPKIRKKGCGSQLLTQEKTLTQLIQAMRQNVSIPVTVKIRIDGNQGEYCDIELVKALEQAGADAIIVHGRHWTHDYDIPCQVNRIAQIVDAVNIPVIANGDVHDVQSAKDMFEQTHCAGVMIARASVGQPWLFQQIAAELTGQPFEKPNLYKIGRLFLEHAKGLIDLDGEKNAMMQCRKFGKYYARELPEKQFFLDQLYQLQTLAELTGCIDQYFLV